MSSKVAVMQDIPIEVWENPDLLAAMQPEKSARDAADEYAAGEQHVTTDDPPEQRVIYMQAIVEGDDMTEIEVDREHAEFARIRYLFRAVPRG